jgi:hypothetical protein
MGFVPMQLGSAKFTTSQSNHRDPFEFAPPALVLLAQADVVSDAPADSNGLDLLDCADHLEVHAGLSLRGRLLALRLA